MSEPIDRRVPYDDPQWVRDDVAEFVRDENIEALADLALRLLADLESARSKERSS